MGQRGLALPTVGLALGPRPRANSTSSNITWIQVQTLLQESQQCRQQVHVSTMNLFISQAWQRSLLMFQELDVIARNCLLSTLADKHLWRQAVLTLDEVDVIGLSSCSDACGKAGEWQHAAGYLADLPPAMAAAKPAINAHMPKTHIETRHKVVRFGTTYKAPTEREAKLYAYLHQRADLRDEGQPMYLETRYGGTDMEGWPVGPQFQISWTAEKEVIPPLDSLSDGWYKDFDDLWMNALGHLEKRGLLSEETLEYLDADPFVLFGIDDPLTQQALAKLDKFPALLCDGTVPTLDEWEMLWLVNAMLETDLPKPWTCYKGIGSIVCYLRADTGQVTWKHPFYDYFRQLREFCRQATRDEVMQVRCNRLLWSYEATRERMSRVDVMWVPVRPEGGHPAGDLHSKGFRKSHAPFCLVPCALCVVLPAKIHCTFTDKSLCHKCYAMKHIKMLPRDGKENQPRRINYVEQYNRYAAMAKQRSVLSTDWHPFYDARGVKYYHNFSTGERMRQSPIRIPNTDEAGVEGNSIKDAKAALGEEDVSPGKEDTMAGGSFVGALFVGKLPFLCEDKRFGTGPLRGTAPMPLSGFDSLKSEVTAAELAADEPENRLLRPPYRQLMPNEMPYEDEMATNVALGSLPWRRANEKLHELDADLVTYGSILKVSSMAGVWEPAVLVLEQMVSVQLEPNMICLNAAAAGHAWRRALGTGRDAVGLRPSETAWRLPGTLLRCGLLPVASNGGRGCTGFEDLC
eukprot:g27018.t1